jgi:hypothetical protein
MAGVRGFGIGPTLNVKPFLAYEAAGLEAPFLDIER